MLWDSRNLCILILKREGKPFSADEITKILMDKQLIRTTVKTSYRAINAQIYSEIEKKGSNSRFPKVDISLFGFRGWYEKEVFTFAFMVRKQYRLKKQSG